MSDCEELVDYSQLIKKKKPKRPKSNEDQTTYAQDALFQCLENKGRLQKSVCEGIVDSNWIKITVNKGTHLHTVGMSHQGHIRLNPEEAAFLVSRNALIVRDEDRVLTFEDLCEFIVEDTWLTFDKYLVYAYLKRLGYIVMRSKAIARQPHSVSYWQWWSEKISHWFNRSRKKRGPLVWNYSCSDYYTVYSTLQIIPSSSPLYKPFNQAWMIDWDVYKPRPTWKKKDPGLPDYRIVVKNIQEPIPTLDSQYQLFSQSNDTQLLIALVGDTEGVLFLNLMSNTVQTIVKP
ncbi:hypothetical protein G6F46_002415 [Rhizopus delemar]|uniref:tRNA-splicing endonuclease subunit Sen54 N-terminal domain-containing protein n=2 Tax=Rhizopus TaxID=4842 RepID=A0A9P7CT30_9FUNG|nr:hypothetical protein G6F43_000993 [Rhizopus delemar]KAG1552384.1 hypothetical protein G6F51_001265 [Rhizopus arrhizus]KAG1464070.1 hypothetical protein G6F55_002004 [Rhizopus delemar]KAG1503202.1 hypothetical protein G6F54_001838 [Rhizopus delemar]KAG1516647.1 hypothetical protein G6F53_001987 [Rhizopus delemar]